MEIFKTEIEDIQPMDISKKEKELLNRSIEYVYGILENLYKKYSKSVYELYGIIRDPKSYVIVLRGGSYMYNHPKNGPRLRQGNIYLKMTITYTNGVEEPIIHVDLIKANENMLTGNEIINISKKIGEIINAKYIELSDASTLNGACLDSSISMTTLYILSIGVSWYNTKGFLSPYFEIEQEHNHRLLSLNIVDFLFTQREYTMKYLNAMGNLDWVNDKKTKRRIEFIDNMNSFFDFFERYDKNYPFFEDIGLFITREMTVQEVFTRIKLFILRELPKNRTTIYKSVCSHLNWLFSEIEAEYIDVEKSEEEIQQQLSSLNPMVMVYCDELIYDMKNPIIPTPLNYNISRRKTSRKRGTSIKSKKQKSRSKKSTTRRKTYG
jgi:hypothetical protein